MITFTVTYAGERYCKIHKDQWNPHSGPIEAIAHALLEWKAWIYLKSMVGREGADQ
jgi:hypothetical protein